jgi:hypothetical protein
MRLFCMSGWRHLEGSWNNPAVTTMDDATRAALLRRGFALEYIGT